MASPETYNRVSKIENTTAHNTLKALKALLLVIVVASAAAIYTGQLSQFIGLTVSIGSLIAAVIIGRIIISRSRRCLFCNWELHHINRDMILSPKYLAMQGIKHADYYFADNAWGKQHSDTGWAKISHRAKACHHCSVSQEGYIPHSQAAIAEELEAIKSLNIAH